MPGGADVPVVMMTGLDDVESIRRAYEVGRHRLRHQADCRG